MTQMSRLPWPTANETNAIRVPSGDHTGSKSCCVVEAVRLASARVATSIVNRSDVPFSQQRSNTSLLPSGDQDGFASISELVVDPHDTGPVGEHQVELGEPAVAVRDERDAGPVGRPHGRPVGGARRLCRQLLATRAVRLGDEDPEGLAGLRSGRVDDLRAVRRPRGIPLGNRGRGQPGASAPRCVHDEQVRAARDAGPPHVRDPVARGRPRRLQLGRAGGGRQVLGAGARGVDGEQVGFAVPIRAEHEHTVARTPRGRLGGRLGRAEPDEHDERDARKG